MVQSGACRRVAATSQAYVWTAMTPVLLAPMMPLLPLRVWGFKRAGKEMTSTRATSHSAQR